MRRAARIVVLLAAAIALGSGATAQDVAPISPDPAGTLAQLEALVIPVRDRVDLARRINGLTDADLPPAPADAPDYAVGDAFEFTAIDTDERIMRTIPAQVEAVGEHIVIWVQTDNTLPDDVPGELAAAFDERIYDAVRALWGSENIPGVDGDPRVHLLLARGLGGSIAGYFAGDHTLPRAVYPPSNEREMMFFNLDTVSGAPARLLESVLAHEFQHMIRHNLQINDDTWMNEGLSVFTESALYGGANSSAFAYLLQPETQLTDWNADSALRAANYGAAGLFMTYLHDRFGLEALQELSAHPSSRAWAGVEALAAARDTSGEQVFADWLIANLWLSLSDLPDPVYMNAQGGGAVPLYADTPASNFGPPTYEPGTDQAVPPFAAHHYFIEDVDSANPLISLSADVYAPLIAADSADAPFWVTGRADQSEPRLTYTVDLTDATAARLDYRVWFDLEEAWDYGYVMVSTDGARWTPLSTSHMTTDDPFSVAYGPGYTGVSDGWQTESSDLTPYIGGEVQIRFSTITDDAITRPGLAIDEVTVFADDAAIAVGAPRAEGWVYTDNQLYVPIFVQAIALTEDGRAIASWGNLIPDGTLHLLGLGYADGAVVESLWVIVSPVVEFTTEPIPYRLDCC